MPTKSHRSNLPKHSRSSSASKLSAGHSSSRLAQTAGLQFTPAAPANPRPKDKEERTRKGNHLLDNHTRAASPFPRPASRNSNSSFQRSKSRDHIQPLQPQKSLAPPKRKSGKGFTIASNSSDEAGTDDEEAWTSESASGAVTPNVEAQSDGEDDDVVLDRMLKGINDRPDLQRVDTARASTQGGLVALDEPDRTPLQKSSKPLPESDSAVNLSNALSSSPPRPPRIQTQMNGYVTHGRHQSQTQPSTPSSRAKRISTHRPPSVHSITSLHQPVRPHPLIRGPSFAGPSAPITNDNVGLTPLTAMSDQTHMDGTVELSSSPTASLRSFQTPNIPHSSPSKARRTSVSSVATLPLPSTPNPASSALQATQQRDARERQRTLSSLSTSSSTAAISSLFHLPSLSRAPSPPHQSTKALVGKRTKFPPSPFIRTREWGADVLALPDGTSIHPLLPAPYMQTHLCAMSTRSMLRESYDRVKMAKSHGRR